MNIGENIKKIRIDKGLSRQDLASELEVSESTISRYENNKREPNMATLKKIGEILNVPLADLLREMETYEEIDLATNKKYYNSMNEENLKKFLKDCNINLDLIYKSDKKNNFLSDLYTINPIKLELNSYIKNFDNFSKENLVDFYNSFLEYHKNYLITFIENEYNPTVNEFKKSINNLMSLLDNRNEIIKNQEEIIKLQKEQLDNINSILNIKKK
ncbi:helix-turn-helix transcriptional regulator [Clostridium perfringens]|nr:helix-turn-helix transcriptional regulator [Clostridium perfringens]